MSGEQLPLFDIPEQRPSLIEQYNVLTEQKWNLMDEMASLELGRIAILKSLRGEE